LASRNSDKTLCPIIPTTINSTSFSSVPEHSTNILSVKDSLPSIFFQRKALDKLRIAKKQKTTNFVLISSAIALPIVLSFSPFLNWIHVFCGR
jgi:hypothetical protein